MRTEPQGKIEYTISIVIPENAPSPKEYSKVLWLQILSENIPQKKVVYFNGEFSRTEQETFDYGHRSETLIIRKANSEMYTYCKAFPRFNFCFEVNEPPAANREYVPPQIEWLDQYKDIAGYRCRKARVLSGRGKAELYFTDSLSVNDPTNAVLQQTGISGLIMEYHDIPDSQYLYYYLRHTVSGMDFSPLNTKLFSVPDGYERFTDIDAVRQEDRKLAMEESSMEWQTHPLSNEEKDMFTGYWLLDSENDVLMVHIVYEGSKENWTNEYTFKSTNLSAGIDLTTEENARMVGRSLWVDEPPNYRVYRYDKASDMIGQMGSHTFRYRRSSEQEIQELKKKLIP